MAVERDNAQRGQAVRLEIQFRKSGTLFDPVTVRQVEIRDRDNVLLATISGAGIVRDGVGEYHVDWFISATEPAVLHHDRWYATATSGANEKQFTLSFMVLPAGTGEGSPGLSYVTLEDLRASLPSDSLLSDEQLTELGALAEEIVDYMAGENFLPVSESRIFNGSGTPLLTVRRAIQSVSQIRTLCGCCDGSWSIMDIGCIRILPSRTALTIGNLVPRPFRSWIWGCGDRFTCCCGGTGSFPMGSANVEVTGEWGAWTTVPRQIQAAVKLLVRYAGACDDPAATPSNPFESESIAMDRQYKMREIYKKTGIDGSTGYPDVDSMIERVRGLSLAHVKVGG